MRIGDVSRITGLAPSAIRYYERADMFSPGHIARHPNGYRDYSDAALRRLQLILAGRAAGFSLVQMRTTMRDWETLTYAARESILGEQLRAIELRINELERSRDTILAALTQAGSE